MIITFLYFNLHALADARDLLSSVQEPQLVQFIINKLEGNVYQVVEGNIYTRVTDLLNKLKTIFAPTIPSHNTEANTQTLINYQTKQFYNTLEG